MMPNLSDMTPFGSPQSAAVGNDFEGPFYVFNWAWDGEQLGYGAGYGNWNDFVIFYSESLCREWLEPSSVFAVLPLPQKLYATQFMLPLSPSIFTPRAFGMRDAVKMRFITGESTIKG